MLIFKAQVYIRMSFKKNITCVMWSYCIAALQAEVSADTAVAVVSNLTSIIAVGTEEDQIPENLEVINNILSSVTNLIGTGNFTASKEVHINVPCNLGICATSRLCYAF